MLSSELERFEISVSQQLPEAQFGVGEGPTHSSRPISGG
jgi:hypothetical protein